MTFRNFHSFHFLLSCSLILYHHHHCCCRHCHRHHHHCCCRHCHRHRHHQNRRVIVMDAEVATEQQQRVRGWRSG
ncbi:hypothetical protein IHE45_11G040400 [Dioscorea alata]|uniref:Uncharacterized protein n=1 Tax=Dioscorea alata TaxID=55571 RepID=A0ACB7V5P5_DIOAL|nr:hypothetical protein IHE45_11G040400 [Dioscorea alata]